MAEPPAEADAEKFDTEAIPEPSPEEEHPAPPEPAPEPAPEPVPEVVSDDVVFDETPAPLLGTFRPSSLRLIDEAVAAAEAFEPSLDDDEPPQTTNGASLLGGNGVHATLHD